MAEFPKSFNISWETRDCMVGDKPGLFHTWEQFSHGVISRVYGIVEFADETKRVDPEDIRFCDSTHANLYSFTKWLEERENGVDN